MHASSFALRLNIINEWRMVERAHAVKGSTPRPRVCIDSGLRVAVCRLVLQYNSAFPAGGGGFRFAPKFHTVLIAAPAFIKPGTQCTLDLSFDG